METTAALLITDVPAELHEAYRAGGFEFVSNTADEYLRRITNDSVLRDSMNRTFRPDRHFTKACAVLYSCIAHKTVFEEGASYESQDLLSDLTGYSRHTCNVLLQRLVAADAIEVVAVSDPSVTGIKAFRCVMRPHYQQIMLQAAYSWPFVRKTVPDEIIKKYKGPGLDSFTFLDKDSENIVRARMKVMEAVQEKKEKSPRPAAKSHFRRSFLDTQGVRGLKINHDDDAVRTLVIVTTEAKRGPYGSAVRKPQEVLAATEQNQEPSPAVLEVVDGGMETKTCENVSGAENESTPVSGSAVPSSSEVTAQTTQAAKQDMGSSASARSDGSENSAAVAEKSYPAYGDDRQMSADGKETEHQTAKRTSMRRRDFEFTEDEIAGMKEMTQEDNNSFEALRISWEKPLGEKYAGQAKLAYRNLLTKGFTTDEIRKAADAYTNAFHDPSRTESQRNSRYIKSLNRFLIEGSGAMYYLHEIRANSGRKAEDMEVGRKDPYGSTHRFTLSHDARGQFWVHIDDKGNTYYLDVPIDDIRNATKQQLEEALAREMNPVGWFSKDRSGTQTAQEGL